MFASSISRSAGWRITRVAALRSFSSTTVAQDQYDVVVVGKCCHDTGLLSNKSNSNPLTIGHYNINIISISQVEAQVDT